MMKNRKRKMSVILVLCLAILSIFAPGTVFSAAGAGFYLTQDIRDARTGQQFVVCLNGENLKDMYAYESKISFDADKLELVKSVSNLQGFSVSPKAEGSSIFIAFTKTGDNKGEDGNKLLCSLTFKCRAEGDAAVRLESVKVVDSNLISETYAVGKTVTVTISESSNTGEAAGTTETNVNQTTVTTSLSADEIDKLYRQASANESGVKRIEIEIEKREGANEYIEVFPTEILASGGYSADIVIKTPLGIITIPDDMFKPEDLEGQTDISVSLKLLNSEELSESLRQTAGSRPVIQLSVRAGGNLLSWNNPEAPVKVSIPYKPTEQEAAASDHIVVLCVDDPQNPVAVPSGYYNPGTQTVTFIVHHFSLYTIAFIEKTFDDLAGYPWAKSQVEALASKGIINGISQRNFGPSLNITRADFLCLLIRVCGFTGTVDSNFDDVKKTDYFYEPVGVAKKYGIATGIDSKNFKPNEQITRQDMMVLAERAMKLTGKLNEEGNASDLAVFRDTDRISPYAVPGVATLIKEGIIKGNNNRVDPLTNTTRAEAAVVIYRLYNWLFK